MGNKNKKISIESERGFAAVLTTIIVLGVVAVIIGSVAAMTLTEQRAGRNSIKSAQAYFAAEGGIEDSLYRVIKGKNYQATNLLEVGSSTASISISGSSNQKTIRVSGEQENRFRNLEVKLIVSTDAISFHYGVQVGEGGLEMENNSQVLGSIYSNGNIHGDQGATIDGDAFVATGMSQDQTHSVFNSDQIFGQANPIIDITQSFKAGTSSILAKVSVYIKKTGNPGDRTVRILTDSSGSPSKTSLASATLREELVSASYGWVDIVFSSPPNLTQGTTYWLVIDASSDSNDYWFWAKDQNQGYADGQAKYSQDWNAPSPIWTTIAGDLDFKTFMGGQMTSLENVIVKGDAYANSIFNSQICGDAYFQTIDYDSSDFLDNPSSGTCALPLTSGIGHPGSADPALQNMPISDSNMQDWREEATNGGVYPGDLNVSTNMTVGPQKIDGNLIMNSSNKVLTVSGTIYVTGYIDISNGSTIHCAASYGANSCVVLTDKWIHVSNNGVFGGSGQAGSYIMILSASNCDGTFPTGCGDHNSAIDLHNNAAGAIFYANNGYAYLHNGVNISELVARRIQLEQNAIIRYERGLENAKFSSGPGGTWAIISWKEVP
ncbi:MAG: choice-of-anchor R domain-containing protein [bacterium]